MPCIRGGIPPGATKIWLLWSRALGKYKVTMPVENPINPSLPGARHVILFAGQTLPILKVLDYIGDVAIIRARACLSLPRQTGLPGFAVADRPHLFDLPSPGLKPGVTIPVVRCRGLVFLSMPDIY